MHQDFLLTESVVPVIISINRKNRKEILRKKEIRLKKLGIIGYGLRSETMMKAFQGIQAPVRLLQLQIHFGARSRKHLHRQQNLHRLFFMKQRKRCWKKKG